MTVFIAKKIQAEYNYRKSINYPYNETDIKWDNLKIFIKFPLYSFVSGTLAGLLGIGGGLILGPLLLELGIHPVVSTATSNFLVLFTSSSTSIQFILLVWLYFNRLGNDEFAIWNCLYNRIFDWIFYWNNAYTKVT